MISAKWSPRQGSDTIQSLLGKRSERIESASWYILISRAKRGRLPLTVRHVISKLCGQLRLRLRIILLWKRCLQKKRLRLARYPYLVSSGAMECAPALTQSPHSPEKQEWLWTSSSKPTYGQLRITNHTCGQESEEIYARARPKRVGRAFVLLSKTNHGSL